MTSSRVATEDSDVFSSFMSKQLLGKCGQRWSRVHGISHLGATATSVILIPLYARAFHNTMEVDYDTMSGSSAHYRTHHSSSNSGQPGIRWSAHVKAPWSPLRS